MFLQLAQFDGAKHVEIGAWIVVLIGVLGGVWLVIQIFFSLFPRRPEGQEFVTQEQFKDSLSEIKVAIARLDLHLQSLVPKTEMEKNLDKVEREIQKYNEYIHQRVHDLSGTMQGMLTGQSAMAAKVDLIVAQISPHPPTPRLTNP